MSNKKSARLDKYYENLISVNITAPEVILSSARLKKPEKAIVSSADREKKLLQYYFK